MLLTGMLSSDSELRMKGSSAVTGATQKNAKIRNENKSLPFIYSFLAEMQSFALPAVIL